MLCVLTSVASAQLSAGTLPNVNAISAVCCDAVAQQAAPSSQEVWGVPVSGLPQRVPGCAGAPLL